jgi:hypothetical protein
VLQWLIIKGSYKTMQIFCQSLGEHASAANGKDNITYGRTIPVHKTKGVLRATESVASIVSLIYSGAAAKNIHYRL